MCYFVEINLPRQELEERFGIPMINDPRYMPGVFHSAFIRPFLPVITGAEQEQIGVRQWGLIPSWVKDEKQAEKIRNATYNAKAETLWEKPSFRSAARRKRCLVPVHGFYEWHHAPGLKVPFYIKRQDDRPFALAGLYEDWTNPNTGEIMNTFNVITTDANPLLEKIHNSKKRMPVILPEKQEWDWIDPDMNLSNLKDLLAPFPERELIAYSISRRILDKELDIRDESILEPKDYEETRGLSGDDY